MMSRRFRLTPTGGYLRNGAYDEPSIDSIKLQRKLGDCNTEWHKNEKMKGRTLKGGKPFHVFDNKLKGQSLVHHEFPQQRKRKLEVYEDENEELEKSDLSFEHEQPTYNQSDCYISGVTQSDSKRGTSTPRSNEAGTGIHIRIPTKKGLKPVENTCREKLCSTSGRGETPLLPKNVKTQLVDQQPNKSGRKCGMVLRFRIPVKHLKLQETTCNERLCSTSGREDLPALPKNESHRKMKDSNEGAQRIAEEQHNPGSCEELRRSLQEGATPILKTKSHRDKKQRKEDKYNALFECWVPPPIETFISSENNDEWLFGSREEVVVGQATKGEAGTSGAVSSTISTCWPRAQYLPEADTYALPYASIF